MEFFKRKSSIVLFTSFLMFIAFFFVFRDLLIQRRSLGPVLVGLYSFIPWVVAHFCRKKEVPPIPEGRGVVRYSYSAILAGLAIGTLATGAAFLWGPSDPSLEAVQRAFQESVPAWGAGAIVLISGAASIFISRIVLFYWVGYLWESLKANPFKAVWFITVLWSIWIFPEVFYNDPADFKLGLLKLPQVLVVHIAAVPLLLYYWVHGGSIRAPAYFYAFLRIGPMILLLFFPQLIAKAQSMVLWGTEALLIVGYSWFLGIYSRGSWEKKTSQTPASSS